MTWLGRFDDFNFEAARNDPPKQKNTHSFGRGTVPNKQVPNASRDSTHGGYLPICEITSSVNYASIIGAIIAKEGPRSIISKRGTGNERFLVSFTVRDSDTAFINITCWGGDQYVKMLASELQIGDVVDIKGAQVQSKSNNPADGKFKPWTPSPCQLTTGENQGTVVPYSGLDIEDYTYLMHIPTRPSNDFYTLEDIQANGMSLQGEHINILAVVKKIWPTRQITTKTGKTTSKVDVVLCDETCMSFNLTLWDSFATLTESWIPMDTVIFAVDVKITYNEYRSAMTASADSKTIFTMNPDTAEASCVKEYSKTQVSFLPSESFNSAYSNDAKDPPLETIANVINVRDAKNLIDSSEEAGFGVVYAFLSHFDIDGDEKTILREVCSGCHKFVQESSGFVCGNPNCSGGELSLDGVRSVEYSLTVGLSDHTGSLEHCYVPPDVVEQLLRTKANEFRDLHGPQRTNIKWSFLFERVKAVIKIRHPSNGKQRCSVKVLSLEKANLDEVVSSGLK